MNKVVLLFSQGSPNGVLSLALSLHRIHEAYPAAEGRFYLRFWDDNGLGTGPRSFWSQLLAALQSGPEGPLGALVSELTDIVIIGIPLNSDDQAASAQSLGRAIAKFPMLHWRVLYRDGQEQEIYNTLAVTLGEANAKFQHLEAGECCLGKPTKEQSQWLTETVLPGVATWRCDFDNLVKQGAPDRPTWVVRELVDALGSDPALDLGTFVASKSPDSGLTSSPLQSLSWRCLTLHFSPETFRGNIGRALGDVTGMSMLVHQEDEQQHHWHCFSTWATPFPQLFAVRDFVQRSKLGRCDPLYASARFPAFRTPTVMGGLWRILGWKTLEGLVVPSAERCPRIQELYEATPRWAESLQAYLPIRESALDKSCFQLKWQGEDEPETCVVSDTTSGNGIAFSGKNLNVTKDASMDVLAWMLASLARAAGLADLLRALLHARRVTDALKILQEDGHGVHDAWNQMNDPDIGARARLGLTAIAGLLEGLWHYEAGKGLAEEKRSFRNHFVASKEANGRDVTVPFKRLSASLRFPLGENISEALRECRGRNRLSFEVTKVGTLQVNPPLLVSFEHARRGEGTLVAPGLLKGFLDEILTNAAKYAWKNLVSPLRLIRIEISEADGHTILDLADNGVGLTERELGELAEDVSAFAVPHRASAILASRECVLPDSCGSSLAPLLVGVVHEPGLVDLLGEEFRSAGALSFQTQSASLGDAVRVQRDRDGGSIWFGDSMRTKRQVHGPSAEDGLKSWWLSQQQRPGLRLQIQFPAWRFTE